MECLDNYDSTSRNLKDYDIKPFAHNNMVEINAEGKDLEESMKEMLRKTHEIASKGKANLVYMPELEMLSLTNIKSYMRFYFSPKKQSEYDRFLQQKNLLEDIR